MARTIADLEGAEQIQEGHLTEAIGYPTLSEAVEAVRMQDNWREVTID